MQESKFKVVFCGQLREGCNPVDVAESLTSRFKLASEKARKLVDAKREFTIHRGAEHRKAYAMKSALEEIGMVARLERVAEKSTASAPQPLPRSAPAPSPSPSNPKPLESAADSAKAKIPVGAGLSLVPLDDEHDGNSDGGPAKTAPSTEEAPFSCPKCSLEQVKRDTCEGCGVVFAKLDALAAEGQAVRHVSGRVEVPPQIRNASLEDEHLDADQEGKWDKAKGKVAGIVGGAGVALFLLKKFKILKVAAIFGAASYGWMFDGLTQESMELCLGEAGCEAIVEEKAEVCWEASGMADRDWDDMSDAEYERVYYDLEKQFFGCFTDTSGRRLFLEPTYLQVLLVQFCDYDQQCMQSAAMQRHQCYEDAGLDLYAEELSHLDDYGALESRQREMKDFFGCFHDASGNQLYSEALAYWGP